MKTIEIYSLCVKVVLFLQKNGQLKRDELLYLVALSDFYKDNTMLSKNIKNINSLNLYTRLLNEAIALLLATKMVIFYGNRLHLSVIGQIFSQLTIENSINKNLIDKINYISDNYSCKEKLSKVYDELVEVFIFNNLGGNNEN